jgi:prephenate dehydrogenase
MQLCERMVIAGVGLIGGSLGLAIRERGLAKEVVGYGRGEENLRTAVDRGAIDRYSRSPAEAARGADLIVLCVPVRSTRAVAAPLLAAAAPDALVIDAGSVKGDVVREMEDLVRAPAAFVGCHPIAGTELAGAANAVRGLYEGQLCLVTPTPQTDATALTRARAVWEAVGMRVETISPEEHDRLLAMVSHLPHVAAYALIATIEGRSVGARDPIEYSGGGLRDTTRIAASPGEMWRDIFLGNRQEVLRAIDEFVATLGRLRSEIASGDAAALDADLDRARRARQRLKERRS